MGGAIFGYDIGTAGGVSSMEPFLRDFFPDVHRRMQAGAGVGNYCKFDSQLLTLFTSSLYVSGLLTAVLVASWFTERHGRRPSMILGGVAYLGGAAIRGVDAVDEELDDIVAANATGQAGDNGLRLILSQRRYRPQLAMAFLIPSFTQLTGINAIGFYAPVLLRTIGMSESAALLSTIVMVIISSTSTFASMLLVDRFGRRTLLVLGGVQMFLSEVLIGGIMAAKLRDEGQ
uniref:Major facilitator superfamily (MFS) profile domain-containing protein n=1 Tax=Aegilops tauschii subsp. strangulata TaxID=200361 RepID=A0A453E520_AEGTS